MFAEDLSVFFDTDDFATAVTLDGVAVNGIISSEYVESNFVETNAPVFSYAKADMPTAFIDSVLIEGMNVYKVKGVHPDETLTINKLILEKQ